MSITPLEGNYRSKGHVYSDKVKIHHLRPISAYNAVRASEKSSNIANRKSTTRFPTSYRRSPYVTPNSPKGSVGTNSIPNYLNTIDNSCEF